MKLFKIELVFLLCFAVNFQSANSQDTISLNLNSALQYALKNNTNIILIRSVESLSETWKKAKLSISRGGYNTTIETLCSRIPALIVPYCNESNGEQKIRTTRLQKEGLVEMLHLENTSELQIARAVNKALCFSPIDKKINLNGADNTALILKKLS